MQFFPTFCLLFTSIINNLCASSRLPKIKNKNTKQTRFLKTVFFFLSNLRAFQHLLVVFYFNHKKIVCQN